MSNDLLSVHYIYEPIGANEVKQFQLDLQINSKLEFDKEALINELEELTTIISNYVTTKHHFIQYFDIALTLTIDEEIEHIGEELSIKAKINKELDDCFITKTFPMELKCKSVIIKKYMLEGLVQSFINFKEEHE